MESLGLNKLAKCFKSGTLTEKINWSIDERQGIQRLLNRNILSSECKLSLIKITIYLLTQ